MEVKSNNWTVFTDFRPNANPVYYLVEAPKGEACRLLREHRRVEPYNYTITLEETVNEEELSNPWIDVVYRQSKPLF